MSNFVLLKLPDKHRVVVVIFQENRTPDNQFPDARAKNERTAFFDLTRTPRPFKGVLPE